MLYGRPMRCPSPAATHLLRTAALGTILWSTSACDKKAPPDPHLAQGYALLAKDPGAALAEFEQARDKQDVTVLLGRAMALEGLRKYQDAEKVLEVARKKSDDASILLPLGRVRVMLGKKEEAKNAIDQAARKAPWDFSALLVETCLADTPQRAEVSLSHLQAWPQELANIEKKGSPRRPPSEYHLARASVLGTLERLDDRQDAIDKANAEGLNSARDTLATSVLAARAGQRDFSGLLLERLLRDSNKWEQMIQIAEIAHLLGRHDLTARALTPLSNSDDERLLLIRARHDIATQNAGATHSIGKALRSDLDKNTRTELRVALVEALLRKGDLPEARKQVDLLLEKSKGEKGAELLLARIELAGKNPEKALEIIAPLLEGTPPPGATEIAALAHAQANQPEQALTLARALLNEYPKNHLAARIVIGIELEAKHHAALVKEIEQLVERAPDDAELRGIWIELLEQVERPERVQAALEKAVADLPRSAGLWLRLAQFHQKRKHSDQYLSVLQTAYEKNKTSLLAASLANALTELGRREDAAPLYRAILKKSENDVVALNNLAIFHVEDLNDPKRGVELAEAAHRLAPKQPAILDTLGWALFKRGTGKDIERAEELLVSAQDQLESPTSRYHLAAVLIARGKSDEGKAILRKILALTQDFPEAAAAHELLERGS